jgi:hypothetical protein
MKRKGGRDKAILLSKAGLRKQPYSLFKIILSPSFCLPLSLGEEAILLCALASFLFLFSALANALANKNKNSPAFRQGGKAIAYPLGGRVSLAQE